MAKKIPIPCQRCGGPKNRHATVCRKCADIEKKKPPIKDLKNLYIKKRFSIADIAEKAKVGYGTVRRWLEESGVSIRVGSPPLTRLPNSSFPLRCKLCKEPKMRGSYTIQGVRRSECRLCQRSKRAIRITNNPSIRIRQKSNLIKRTYGITLDEYNTLLKRQNGVCAICKRLPPTGFKRRLSVDHDHATNRVRGLLCDNCNSGIGLLKDDPKLLRIAMSYLRRFSLKRISREEMIIDIAYSVAARGTCPRAKVGAVLVKNSRVISHGYNGSPPGEVHCEDAGCIIENNHCVRVLHAEENAIIWAGRQGISTQGALLYVTYPICPRCEKFAKAAGIIGIKIV
jgi:dCMP deaminase